MYLKLNVVINLGARAEAAAVIIVWCVCAINTRDWLNVLNAGSVMFCRHPPMCSPSRTGAASPV